MRRRLCCSAPTGTWLFTCAVGNRSIQTQLTLLWLAANCLLQGANYIPSHIVHTNVSTQMLNDTLEYALESNMNM